MERKCRAQIRRESGSIVYLRLLTFSFDVTICQVKSKQLKFLAGIRELAAAVRSRGRIKFATFILGTVFHSGGGTHDLENLWSDHITGAFLQVRIGAGLGLPSRGSAAPDPGLPGNEGSVG